MEIRMTYEEFKNEMQSLLNKSFKYTPDQAGSRIFSEKMADLAEKYPEYEKMLDVDVEMSLGYYNKNVLS